MRSTTDQHFRVSTEYGGLTSCLCSIRHVGDVLYSFVDSACVLSHLWEEFVRCHVVFGVHIKRKGWAL